MLALFCILCSTGHWHSKSNVAPSPPYHHLFFWPASLAFARYSSCSHTMEIIPSNVISMRIPRHIAIFFGGTETVDQLPMPGGECAHHLNDGAQKPLPNSIDPALVLCTSHFVWINWRSNWCLPIIWLCFQFVFRRVVFHLIKCGNKNVATSSAQCCFCMATFAQRMHTMGIRNKIWWQINLYRWQSRTRSFSLRAHDGRNGDDN